MLRKMLSVVAGVSVLCLVIAAALSRNVQAQVSMKLIGLPDKGLSLIGPGDSTFEAKASDVLRGRKDIAYEILKPYSVILYNTSAKTVVAYALRWEYTAPKAPNGIGIWDRNFGQSTRLLDGSRRKTDPSDDKLGPTIEPGEFKLLTPQSYIGRETLTTSDVADTQYRNYLEIVVNRFGVGDMTVTLDGVFFDDGSFAGPDQSNFFEVFKAEVTAKQDFMTEIVTADKEGRLKEVASKVESSLSEETLSPGATSADFYRYFRSLYAREFVNIRAKFGDQAALGHAHQKFFTKAPTLSK